ncbi:MAG: hypothetical protein ACLPRE_02320 [Limisphaerales bacterium]
MDKVGKPLFLSGAEHNRLHNAFGKVYSDSSLYLKDERVAQLVLLLRLLHQDVGGLAALPKSELREIISSAVGVCGFANPVEAQDVLDVVMEVLETEPPITEAPIQKKL